MAVSIGAQPGLSAGAPKALFSGEYAMNAPARAWDVTPDGQRFLLIRADEQSPAGTGQMNIVQNCSTKSSKQPCAKPGAGGQELSPRSDGSDATLSIRICHG